MKRGRFYQHFPRQERRTLALACAAQLYAAEPDVIAELLSLASDLMHPGTPLDREMRIVATIRAGRKLEQLAKRIETLGEPKPQLARSEPIARRQGSRIQTRLPARRSRRPEGQLEMTL